MVGRLRRSGVWRWPVLCLFAAVAALTPAVAQDPALQSEGDFEALCEMVLNRAVAITEEDCGPLGRNEVCYGYANVLVDYRPGVDPADFPFQVSGDILPLNTLTTIATEPLNLETGTWGMSVLKFQARLPDTRPGENVTFILFGDTQVHNASGDMSAFYLTNGLGELICNTIPEDALLVQVPQGMEVAFTVNGVNITLASTAILQAVPGVSLSMGVVQGHGTMSAAGVVRAIPAGFFASVPLSDDGREPVGAPSAAEPGLSDLRYATVIEVLQILQPGALPPGLALVTLEGPIEAVKEVDGSIVIYGYGVPLPRGQLPGLSVGQWVTVEGVFEAGDVGAPVVVEWFSLDVSDQIVIEPEPTATAEPPPVTATPVPQPPAAQPGSLPEPTPVPTSEPAQEPGLWRLHLTPLCSENPAEARRWRVLNQNWFPVEVTWEVVGTDQTGSLVADARGFVYFFTATVEGANTVRIYVGDELHDQRTSAGAQCIPGGGNDEDDEDDEDNSGGGVEPTQEPTEEATVTPTIVPTDDSTAS